MLATSLPGCVLGSEAFYFLFSLQRHGGGLRHTRSSLWAIPMSPPMADPCSHDVTLHIPTSARSRGIPHAGLRALFPRHSCHEVRADDVTCATSLHGFPCRPARAHRPPETRSTRSANRTRGMQHVEPRTRAHVGTHVFRIPSTLAYILAVHAAGLCPTWKISGPDREDAHVQAVCDVRH